MAQATSITENGYCANVGVFPISIRKGPCRHGEQVQEGKEVFSTLLVLLDTREVKSEEK